MTPIDIRSAQVVEAPKMRVMLCGPLRTGKTHTASTFPRPFFIFPANEGSIETVRGQQVHYDTVDSMAKMDALLAYLMQQHHAGTLGQWCDTVVVESISHYSEIVENEITNGGKKDMDWGAYGGHFMRLRATLWQLPVHVVVVALDKVKTDKHQNVLGHGPRLFGQTGEMFAASCDAVGYTEQINMGPAQPPAFRVHFQQYGAFNAGTRIRGMRQGHYDNFNFAEHLAPLLAP